MKNPDPTTAYVLGVERDGVVTLGRHDTFASAGAVQHIADGYNAEEADNARLERRPVRRRFVVLKATTTYEVLA